MNKRQTTNNSSNFEKPQENQGLLSSFLKKQRYRKVTSLIRNKDNVLDLGCGSGSLKDFLPTTVNYYGLDTEKHWKNKPNYLFVTKVEDGLPEQLKKVNFTVVTALAILEHLKNPAVLFQTASLALPIGGYFIITTPHPIGRTIHDFGASIGLFSSDASEEHEIFFDQKAMMRLAEQEGFRMMYYRRFLFGMNQLCVFVKKKI